MQMEEGENGAAGGVTSDLLWDTLSTCAMVTTTRSEHHSQFTVTSLFPSLWASSNASMGSIRVFPQREGCEKDVGSSSVGSGEN
ncbi:hypothetical protein BT69DRAFT_1291067 [Atractiella rhizophila]|nr:hypothetical protein BT69DRAFT_1291067 [Atractiella rhizophila]